jgi:hypothetical protein
MIVTPYLKSMVSCLTKVVSDGYKEDFKATAKGLKSVGTNQLYTPEQVRIINLFRFEGFTDPTDNAVVYVLETNDGIKGTLVDAYGPAADPLVKKFILETKTANGNSRNMIN